MFTAETRRTRRNAEEMSNFEGGMSKVRNTTYWELQNSSIP